jgi:hypothetical protein
MFKKYSKHNKIITRYVNLFPKTPKRSNKEDGKEDGKEDIEISKISKISIVTEGRLGNHLFQIISCWAYAKKYNLNFVLDKSYKDNNKKYYDSFFSSIKVEDTSNFSVGIKGIYQNILNSFDPFFINRKLIKSYLQNAYNFDVYREEVLNLFFNIKEIKENNNNFFIHIRLTDFLSSPNHNINLDSYYKKAIEYISSIVDINLLNFYIISDDIEKAKQKSYINLIPSSNIIYINNKEYDELKTLKLCSECSGAIIGNSTFGWWGSYLINCPNKIVVCPDKFIKGNHNFSGLYLNYKVISV